MPALLFCEKTYMVYVISGAFLPVPLLGEKNGKSSKSSGSVRGGLGIG